MKILNYAKTIRLEMLEYVAKIVTDYKENEWHNAPEGFCLHSYNDAIEATILASRTIPIHNANGYQGDVHQFLWRANMDYHQLLTSEQPMQQQPATTEYAAQLSAVKTLPELFDFRAKLKAEREEFLKSWYDEGAQANSAHLKAGREAQFFIDRVESQIKALENSGVFLAAVDGRGAVRDSNDLILEKSEAVETLVGNSAGIIAEDGPLKTSENKYLNLTPIEKEAQNLGLFNELLRLQEVAQENEVVYGDFELLYTSGLVAEISISGKIEYAYVWRHEMGYENFFKIKKRQNI